MKTFAKIAAALAILGLVLSSFAFMPGAAGARTTATPFTRDLTVGSQGADVIALQTWLIDRGYAIPAGATGYFGAQTQGVLARYQAASGISPAAGYFGPITRANLYAVTQYPAPAPEEDEDEGENDSADNGQDGRDRDDAEEAVNDVRDALEDARDEVSDADDDRKDIGDAEDLLDEAEETLHDADEALDDRDYDEAMDLADEAEDLIDEALDEIEDEDSDEMNGNVSISAESYSISGSDNDYAKFEVEVELDAFGDDAYVDEDASVSFEFEVLNSAGEEVTSQTRIDAYIETRADEEEGYYVIDEGDSETLTLVVIFDPLASDESDSFRLQLLSINYADSADAPDEEWTARPSSSYRTQLVPIVD